VPSDQCIECKEGLLPLGKDYGWCKVHGVAECPLEHPEVAELASTPTVTPADFERAERALATLPRTENSMRCQLHARRIQFASIEAMEKAGVDISIAAKRPVLEAVGANGEVIYDQTRIAHLASRVKGAVWSVQKQIGEPVRADDVLAVIDSAEIGAAKTELLKAIAELRLTHANFERIRPLAATGAAPGKQLREAEAAFEQATIRLRSAEQALVNLGLPVRASDYERVPTERIADQIQFLGLPAELVDKVRVRSASSNLFPLRAPLDGVVVNCVIVPGEVIDTATTLMEVSDVRTLWLMLSVRLEDAKYVSLGQPVLFKPTDSAGEADIRGKVSWISTAADEQTRTVKVRVELPNADGRLRANTFGTGRIVLREEPAAVVVPNEAVHHEGCCNVVFVRDRNFLREGSPKFFHVRKVRLGYKDADSTEIIAGLMPGEVIAAKNSVVLEAQLLKNQLGAGCGCGKD
jgi:cobalt-zinc-cadmium efflux system membrane fusion protein